MIIYWELEAKWPIPFRSIRKGLQFGEGGEGLFWTVA